MKKNESAVIGIENTVGSNLKRIRQIAEKIDPNLEVKLNFSTDINPGAIVIQKVEGHDRKILITLGKNRVASFPVDEVFTENEVKAAVEKGLRSLGGERPIYL